MRELALLMSLMLDRASAAWTELADSLDDRPSWMRDFVNIAAGCGHIEMPFAPTDDWIKLADQYFCAGLSANEAAHAMFATRQ